MNDALRFTDLSIERAPGITAGGRFSFDGFSPALNLIYGPNGSGKTTAGKALLSLVWANNPKIERASLSGSWTLGDQRWRVDLDHGHPSWFQDGSPSGPPSLPSVDTRSQHWLGLRELLVENAGSEKETDVFARQIAREMLGGHDLEDAKKKLKLTSSPTKPNRLGEEYKKARRAFDEAKHAESQLGTRSTQLSKLRADRKAALAAQGNARILQRALEYRKAASRVDEINRELDQFDEGVSLLGGDELDRSETLNRKIKAREQEQSEAIRHRDQYKAELDQLMLPSTGIPGDTLNAAMTDVDLMREKHSSYDRAQELINASQAEQNARRAAIGGSVTDADLSRLQSVPTERMRKLAIQIAQRHTAAARLELIENEVRAQPKSVEFQASIESLNEIRQGLDILNRWFKAPASQPDTDARWNLALIVAAAFIAALFVAIGILTHPAWYAGILASAVFWILARPSAAAYSDSDRDRLVYEREYAKIDLPDPADWNVEAVEQVSEELLRMRGRAESAEANERAFQELKKTRDQVSEQFQAAESALRESQHTIEAEIGFQIDPLQQEWLHALGQNLAAWQDSNAKTLAARAQGEQGEREIERLLVEFNQRIAPYADSPATDISGAVGLRADLASRSLQHNQLSQKISSTNQALARTKSDLEELQRERATLYEKLGIESDEHAKLIAWMGQFDAFCALRKEAEKACVLRESCRNELRDHPQWIECDLHTLEEMLQQAESVAARFESFTTEIGAIESEVNRAKSAHSIEDAGGRVENARDALLSKRTADEQAVVGDAIIGWMREESTIHAQPAVLRNANSYFQRITHGRFELRLVDTDDAQSFAAYDTRDEVVKTLDALSAGEAVQLLLAVRLGFLEQESSEIKLPIVLDETLGTTDDARAGAIIDAVIEICRTGRQVFYLTAQPDEVGKWIHRVETEPDVQIGLFDLAELRRLRETERTPLSIQRPELPGIPNPDGHDHQSYGARLGVAGLNPRGPIGAVHLWHLLDDPDMLFELLQRRIWNWGAFKSLTAGSVISGIPPEIVNQASVRASAVEAAFLAWRTGRGKPVDREALQNSDVVSETFLDRVLEITSRYNGDGTALLKDLSSGAVPRWRANNTEKLRAFFDEHGYIDPAQILEQSEICIQIQRTFGNGYASDEEFVSWLHSMVNGLPGLEMAHRLPRG